MSRPATHEPRRHLVLAGLTDDATWHTLCRILAHGAGDTAEPRRVRSARDLVAILEKLLLGPFRIALIAVDDQLPGLRDPGVRAALDGNAGWRQAHRVLFARARSDADAWSEVLPPGPDAADLELVVRRALTDYLLRHAPDHIEELGPALDLRLLARGYGQVHRRRRHLERELRTVAHSFLHDVELDDDVLEAALLADVERIFDTPEHRSAAAGSLIIREGTPIDAIYILVSGRVQLTRAAGSHETVFHSRTAGRILGALALARRQHTFFNCRALTDCELIRIPIPQLEQALRSSALFAVHFLTVLLRTLSARSRRATELELEAEVRTDSVSGERDELATALADLERVQLRLVEAERMASLGELTAGIAHELNNPVAAIQRAADHLAGDLLSLVRDRCGELPAGICADGLDREFTSTRQARRLRDELARELGDRALARRLARIGAGDAERAHAILDHTASGDQTLADYERYHALGASLHNIRSAAERVARLVASLRSGARHDRAAVEGVDVRQLLEESLLLFGHRLAEVRVERALEEVPGIRCFPGEIAQVWTNLIGNALDAMAERGRLRVAIDRPRSDCVRVRITDDGPGIPAADLARIFHLNYSTKGGAAQFGLGMGLAICKDIVERHGGSISCRSQPGETEFTVELPIAPDEVPCGEENHE